LTERFLGVCHDLGVHLALLHVLVHCVRPVRAELKGDRGFEVVLLTVGHQRIEPFPRLDLDPFAAFSDPFLGDRNALIRSS
jgi:hypothetical protein